VSTPSRPRVLRDSFSAVHSNLYLDARPEPVDDRHEAIGSEPSEVCISDAREVGRSNPSAAVRSAHGQALPIKGLDDFGG
jgi:hypothetical protein